MKKVFRNVFTAAFLLLILIGCSTTKRIADDEVLYTGVKKMEIIPDSGVKIADAAASDVRSTLSVAPNNPLFSPYIRTPFPIGLWVWNYMEPKREKGGEALDIREVGQGAGTCFDRTARIAYEGSQRHSRK